MTLHFKWLSDNVAAAGQIAPADVAAIAAHGFKSIINNRPDGEGRKWRATSSPPRARSSLSAARARAPSTSSGWRPSPAEIASLGLATSAVKMSGEVSKIR